ncbi:MAG: AAA family ATPase, partial [Sediminibacterium sp.]|nr:AAA family ATPase [Sediminibacterium sp.]
RAGVVDKESGSVSTPAPPPKRVEVVAQLGSFESSALLVSIEVNIERQQLRLRLGAEKPTWEFKGSDGTVSDLGDSYPFLSGPRVETTRLIHFMLRDVLYSSVRRSKKSDNDTARSSDLEKFARLLGSFLEPFSSDLFASSAIRTKPRRTYTPGIEVEDGEGSHVPFELAKLARKRNDVEWTRLKKDIESFGIASGMFSEIEIKSFGHTASDPFQIQFASQGPRMNIVDLGYGTSQVLPLLFNSSRHLQGNWYLVQQPEVHLHPRAQAALGQFFVEAFVSKRQNFVLETHSDYIVDRIRKAIADKVLAKFGVSIIFCERQKLENRVHDIRLNDVGDPVRPPACYREFFIDEQMKLLGL